MIKALCHTDDGPLVICGISDANVEQMKQDRPVVFNLSELGLPPEVICITAKRSDGRAAFPKTRGIGVALSHAMLEQIRERPVLIPLEPRGTLVVFRAKDEAAMERMLRGYFTPQTRVINTGYAPGTAPGVGRN